ncbi:hypothetical protein FM107_06120 [Sphingobacterium sp. JB170]|nr:hypothetical protein FM107_06120 [Sphingobacterium sp. JB170]
MVLASYDWGENWISVINLAWAVEQPKSFVFLSYTFTNNLY